MNFDFQKLSKDLGNGLNQLGKNASKLVGDGFNQAAKVVGDGLSQAPKVAGDITQAVGNMVNSVTQQMTDKKEDKPAEPVPFEPLKEVSIQTALKLIYYLMAVDEAMTPEKEARFEEMVVLLDPTYPEYRESLLRTCRETVAQSQKFKEPQEFMEYSAQNILVTDAVNKDSCISSRELIWNLLGVTFGDEAYKPEEKALIEAAVEKLAVEKADFLLLEQSIQTLLDLENEIRWLKTTDRPYLTIEAQVKTLENRKQIIQKNIQDLIEMGGAF